MATQPADTLGRIADALRSRVTNDRIDCLSSVMPISKRQAIWFVERYGDELEMMLGRRPVVVRSEAVPSGRGAFGRDKGGARASRASVRIRWA